MHNNVGYNIPITLLKMEYKEKVKYLDLVLKKIDNAERFVIYNILSKNTILSHKEKCEIELDLISFGNIEKYDLFELLNPKNTSTRWLKLTKKGEELKDFKKGFEKFKNKSKKTPLSNFEKLSIIGFIITFSYGFYQNRLSNSLGNQQVDYKNKIDSLNTFVLKLNYRIDSLNFEFSKHYKTELLEKEIK
jgi:hypothetical protein